ncbi:MAG: carboxylesterase family protein, partial [Gammaproteobacteria bacterium]|nr:carboxylesterase family protein [Gammaproteobacteria bacterium]
AFAAAVGAPTLAALRALPAAALLRATDPAARPRFVTYPDIDGYFLTEAPAATFARGAQAQVPLLVGSNSAEGAFDSLLGGAAPTPENYRAALERRFGARDALRAAALYPGRTPDEVRRSAGDLAGDLFIAHSTWRWMDLARRTSRAPVYFYYFDRARPAKRHPAPGEKPDTGAVHSGEIEYALGNLGGNHVYAWTRADEAVSGTMEGYFARFIITGDPNGPGLVHWPAATPAQGGVRRLTIGVDTRPTIDRGAARQAFLTRYFADHDSPP